MKKLLLVLFSLVCVFSLIACGGNSVTISVDASATTVQVDKTIKLTVTVSGSSDTSYTFSTNKNGIVTIADDGTVTGKKAGSVIITVTSNADPTVSAKINIKVKASGTGDEIDMGGYTVTVAYSPTSVWEMDPRLDVPAGQNVSIDRQYRKAAFEWVEEEYNCNIEVLGYPVDTDDARWDYINQQATNGETIFDIYWVPTKYLSQMSSGFITMEDIYQSVAPGTLSDADYMARVVKEELKGWSYSSNSITPDDPIMGVNINLLKEIGMEDKEPAKMYLQNKWSFSEFKAWALEIQAKLDSTYGTSAENKHYVIGGMLNDYVINMSRTSGVAICDPLTGQINLENEVPAKAAKLLRELCEAGCVDPSNQPDAKCQSWNDGRCVLSYGTNYWVGWADRWNNTLWGDETEYAYSPFPYNDGLSNSTNRFATYTQDTFTMPIAISKKIEDSGIESEDLTIENIFRCWYMVYQKTQDLINEAIARGEYDKETVRRTDAENKWSSEASVEAWISILNRLETDSSLAIFDPINELDNHWSSDYAHHIAGFISPDLGLTTATDYISAIHEDVQDLAQKFTAKYK